MADIGPLAVSASHQGRGLGSRILTRLEAEHPVTGVGVVSCRSDILPWYERRGYRTTGQVKLDKVRHGIMETTRHGTSYYSMLSATWRP